MAKRMKTRDAAEYVHSALHLLKACPRCNGPRPARGGSYTHGDGTIDAWLHCAKCGQIDVMSRSVPLLPPREEGRGEST